MLGLQKRTVMPDFYMRAGLNSSHQVDTAKHLTDYVVASDLLRCLNSALQSLHPQSAGGKAKGKSEINNARALTQQRP